MQGHNLQDKSDKEEAYMKETNHVKVKFLMACWVIFVFTFSFGLNAAEISRDARKHMIRGQAAIEEAKTEADYQDAVTEFKKAIEYAPEWADAWYNLGVAQEKTGGYQDAIEGFNKYLKLNPNAADSSEVEARIFKLEYRQEKTQRIKEEKERALAAEREMRESEVRRGEARRTCLPACKAKYTECWEALIGRIDSPALDRELGACHTKLKRCEQQC